MTLASIPQGSTSVIVNDCPEHRARVTDDPLRRRSPLVNQIKQPRVTPAEAVGVALSLVGDKPCKFGPESSIVRLVLLAIKLAGWKIVPR